jgi:mannose-6-phosphate isomerase
MSRFNYLYKENRPWGRFFVLNDEPNYKIKRIEIFPNQRLSYQYHKRRSETWIVIQGNPIVTLDDIITHYKKGDSIIIPTGSKHRIENVDKSNIILIEVQTGSYFGEDDIVRIKDDYKRI